MGRGIKGTGHTLLVVAFWHWGQALQNLLISLVTLGQKNLCRTLCIVLLCPKCPTSGIVCANLNTPSLHSLGNSCSTTQLFSLTLSLTTYTSTHSLQRTPPNLVLMIVPPESSGFHQVFHLQLVSGPAAVSSGLEVAAAVPPLLPSYYVISVTWTTSPLSCLLQTSHLQS